MMRLPAIIRDQSGNSVIEMALAAPLLASLLIGMVDISRAVTAKVSLEQAAQRTIERVQAAPDFDTDEIPDLEADAEEAAGTGSDATVTAWLECDHDGTKLDYDDGTCGSGSTYARYVNVSITNTFTPMFGTRFFPGANDNGTVDVSGQATVRTQ
jgi:hypothetical protein